jgi:hypothetical protein
MEQLAIIGRLKDGSEPRARELIEHGPPFDPTKEGFDRHVVYLSADEVVFVFEGKQVEWVLDALVDEPFHWPVLAALEAWRPLLDGQPRIARPAYVWTRGVMDGAVVA